MWVLPKLIKLFRSDDTIVNPADSINADGSLNILNVVLLRSLQGKYFLGQTEDLTISSTTNAWAELHNPLGSGVNIHLNVWTTSNLSSKNYTSCVYFDAGFPVATDLSARISSTNLIEPKAIPKAEIRYKSNTAEIPTGVIVYTRRIPIESTVLAEEDGKFIIPPGKSIGLHLHETTASGVCRAAFGWWEDVEV